MYRTVILALVVVAGAVPAGADPAPPVPCGVQVRRAPPDLGEAIRLRLAQLSACDVRLDVWIVRAEDGLYVIARDELGRVRERIVPDAEVAAALIASWVEIDVSMPLTGTGLLAAPAAPAVRVAIADDAPIRAPARPPLSDVGERVVPPGGDAAGEPIGSTLGFTVFAGFTQAGMTTGGAVIDRDVLAHDGAAIALMAVVSRDVSPTSEVPTADDDFFRETGRWGGALMLELHRRFGTGRIRVTPSIAFGFGATKHEILVAPEVLPSPITTPVTKSETSTGPKLAASVAIGVHVSANLDVELGAGWMLTAYQSGARGVDPSDQAIVVGVGMRYDR
jgi:hypothetical protein